MLCFQSVISVATQCQFKCGFCIKAGKRIQHPVWLTVSLSLWLQLVVRPHGPDALNDGHGKVNICFQAAISPWKLKDSWMISPHTHTAPHIPPLVGVLLLSPHLQNPLESIQVPHAQYLFIFWIRCDHDAGRLCWGAPGQSLEQLLRDVWH